MPFGRRASKSIAPSPFLCVFRKRKKPAPSAISSAPRSPPSRAVRESQLSALSIRRFRCLQGARRRSLHAQRSSRSEARGLLRRPHPKNRRAQEPDGYLYTARTIDPLHPHPWSGAERWILEGVGSHELYDLGHLYEAAVAYYQATGNRTSSMSPCAAPTCSSEPSAPANAKSGPATRWSRWDSSSCAASPATAAISISPNSCSILAGRKAARRRGNAYVEANKRVVDQTDAPAGGHAVRAMYMYSGMADVAALTGDSAYTDALDRIWNDVAARKLHVTGGSAPAPRANPSAKIMSCRISPLTTKPAPPSATISGPPPFLTSRRCQVYRRDGADTL